MLSAGAVLQSILSFTRKQSQPIIVVLLGLILAGGVAGGLHFQTLNKIIAEKDIHIGQLQYIAAKRAEVSEKNNEGRIQQVEERLSEQQRQIRNLNLYIEQIAVVVGQHLESDTDVAARVAKLIVASTPARSLASLGDTPGGLADQMRSSAETTHAELERARRLLGLTKRLEADDGAKKMMFLERRNTSRSNDWLWVLAASVGFFGSLAVLLRRK